MQNLACFVFCSHEHVQESALVLHILQSALAHALCIAHITSNLIRVCIRMFYGEMSESFDMCGVTKELQSLSDATEVLHESVFLIVCFGCNVHEKLMG